MPLSVGTRLGPCEIVAMLGAGGMGEVYRARDTRLKRDVAIKVLPEAFAQDPNRLARFQREAELLATLNHPHIAAVYGLEQADGVTGIVLELVEGHTLADLIAGGPIAVGDASPIALQIADALEAAHEKGVIHRDLKPANIKITPDGNVKVLDFGLAKATEAAHGTPGDPANSPTITSPLMLTGVGMILGTAAYMSPEQAKGRAADKRSDVWAFGCVVYEMLTGTRAFAGDGVSETLAAVLKEEPDWTQLPPSTPAAVRHLLRRCLNKLHKQRLHDIGDARIEIEDSIAAGTRVEGQQADVIGGRRRVVWLSALTLAVGATALVTWNLARRQSDSRPLPLKRFAIDVRANPLNESLVPLALSPDGTMLVYAAGSYEGSQLFVQAFDERDPKPLPGTISAFDPFFSPDGRWVAFMASSGLKKVPVSGGPVVTLSPSQRAIPDRSLTGASWTSDGNIIFAVGQSGGLWRIPADGGDRTQISQPDVASGEVGHGWPNVLPNGKGILFTVFTTTAPDAYRVAVQSADGETRKNLIDGATFARYVPTGHIIYAQSGRLFAVPFDLERLTVTGAALPMLDRVSMDTGLGNARFSVALDGTLAYVEGSTDGRQSLVWVDRRGTAVPVGALERGFEHPSVSPDGERLAVTIRDGAGRDLWLYHFRTGTLSRLTFDGASGLFPVWTPDSRSVVYAGRASGKPVLNLHKVDDLAPPETLVTTDSGYGLYPGSWTPDGQVLAMMQATAKTAGDIGIVDVRGNRIPKPFISTPATEWGAKLSPDGHWMAYISNESGRWEAYVQPFPGPGSRRQVSTDGGTEVVWARSGRELFYRNGRRMMAARIDTAPTFAAGTPEVLFEGPYLLSSPGGHGYDVSPDAQRFLMIKPNDADTSRPIHILLNWFEALKVASHR